MNNRLYGVFKNKELLFKFKANIYYDCIDWEMTKNLGITIFMIGYI